MTRHQITAECGLEALRHQCCNTGDEAVQHDQASALACGEHRAHQRRDLETTEAAQRRARASRRVAGEGSAYRLALAAERRVGDSTAAPHESIGRVAAER